MRSRLCAARVNTRRDPCGRRHERSRLGIIGDPTAGPGRLVDAWREQRFVLVVSPNLLAELGEVLARPKLERWAGDGRGQAYTEAFAARSEEHIDPPRSSSKGVRDPDDDYLVDLTRASGAEILVSLDRDLLDARLSDVTVLDPAKFLARLVYEQRAPQTAND